MGIPVFSVCWHKTLKGFNLLMMLRPSQVHLLLLVPLLVQGVVGALQEGVDSSNIC